MEEENLIPIISLLIVVFLSILITRIATIALTHTGMTREAAKFQARSAYTGAGFTTTESEMVVNHPVRRRIVLILILIGNAGIVAAVSSLILTFVSRDETVGDLALKVVLIIAGMVGLWTLASSKWVDRRLSRYMNRLLKRYTDLGVRDYDSLLHLAGEYRLAEMEVQEEDWLNGKTLAGAQLRNEGINVLGIKKPDGVYIGTPDGETTVQKGDSLILYGRVGAIEELDRRREGYRGDREHREAVEEQEQVEQEEFKSAEKANETQQQFSPDRPLRDPGTDIN
jgi:hypothetical protein